MKNYFYVCAFSVKYITNQNHKNTNKNQKHNERGELSTSSLSKNNDRFIKNLSKANLTDNQIKLLSKKLKFIPTATITKNKKTAPTLARLLQRFHKANALEIHFHGQNKSIHPFYVKSNWEPPFQPSDQPGRG